MLFRSGALLLLDGLEAADPKLAASPDAANLRARICVQNGDYVQAREIWTRVVTANPGNPAATEGIALLDRLANGRWLRARVLMARWLASYAKPVLVGVGVLLALLWLNDYRNSVRAGFADLRELRASCAPGGAMYAAPRQAVAMVDAKLTGIRADMDRWQAQGEQSRKALEEQLGVHAEQLRLDYSGKIAATNENTQAELRKIERTTAGIGSQVSSLETGLNDGKGRTDELGNELHDVHRKLDDTRAQLAAVAEKVAAGETALADVQSKLAAQGAALDVRLAKSNEKTEGKLAAVESALATARNDLAAERSANAALRARLTELDHELAQLRATVVVLAKEKGMLDKLMGLVGGKVDAERGAVVPPVVVP